MNLCDFLLLFFLSWTIKLSKILFTWLTNYFDILDSMTEKQHVELLNSEVCVVED